MPQASRRSLSTRFGCLFGGNELVMQPADLGQKGIWYRVQPAGRLAGRRQPDLRQYQGQRRGLHRRAAAEPAAVLSLFVRAGRSRDFRWRRG